MTAAAQRLTNEAKFTALDLKSVADDGAFEGYASLFDREDLGRDVVLPGAFTDSLASRGPTGVRMLFQHNPAEPIGVWETLREDRKGLFARGRLMPDVSRAREVLSLMRAEKPFSQKEFVALEAVFPFVASVVLKSCTSVAAAKSLFGSDSAPL